MLAGPIAPGPGTGRRTAWIMTAMLFVAWTLAFVGRNVIPLLISSMKVSLGVGDTQIALLHGPAFSIVFAVTGLLLARIVDRANRRNVLVAAIIGSGLGTIAFGLTGRIELLFLARMTVGICQGVLAPASFSLIADLFPSHARGKPIGVLMAAALIGAALANLAGGILLDWFANHAPSLPGLAARAPWQMTMIVLGLPAPFVALAFLLVREPPRPAAPPAAMAASSAMLPYLRANMAAFALLLAAFACHFLIGYGVGAWYPAVLMRGGGLSATATGLLLGPLLLVCAPLAGFLGGWLSDRAVRAHPVGGRLRLVIALLLVEALSVAPTLAAHSVPAVAASFLMFMLASTIVSTASYALLPDLVPPGLRGQIVAIEQMISIFIGLGLGPMLVALVTDDLFGDAAQVQYSMLCVALPAGIVGAALLAAALPPARRIHAALLASR